MNEWERERDNSDGLMRTLRTVYTVRAYKTLEENTSTITYDFYYTSIDIFFHFCTCLISSLFINH